VLGLVIGLELGMELHFFKEPPEHSGKPVTNICQSAVTYTRKPSGKAATGLSKRERESVCVCALSIPSNTPFGHGERAQDTLQQGTNPGPDR